MTTRNMKYVYSVVYTIRVFFNIMIVQLYVLYNYTSTDLHYNIILKRIVENQFTNTKLLNALKLKKIYYTSVLMHRGVASAHTNRCTISILFCIIFLEKNIHNNDDLV